MTLIEMLKAVDTLPPEELVQLRAYIDKRVTQPIAPHRDDAESRIRMMREAFQELREGLSSEELSAMTEAMNSEFVEAWDEASWRD